MRLSKRILLTLIPAAAIVLSTSNAQAQGSVAPEGAFGIGANTSGFSVQYAFSPAVQGGVQLALSSASNDAGSSTNIGLMPYVRILFEGTVNPFIQIGAKIESSSTDPDGGTEASTSETSLFAGFGLEYFFNRNIGVFGAFSLLDLELSSSAKSNGVSVDLDKTTTIGITAAWAGVEWYFSR